MVGRREGNQLGGGDLAGEGGGILRLQKVTSMPSSETAGIISFEQRVEKKTRWKINVDALLDNF